jgi:hypothetical protein
MERIHKLHPSSKYYYQPFKSNSVDKQWVDERYPSTGLQAINTQTFSPAFMHKTIKTWGWENDYVNFLIKKQNGRYLPLFDMAIWFFKYEDFPETFSSPDIIEKFCTYFSLSDYEKDSLFNITNKLPDIQLQNKKTDWNDLSQILPMPPDAPPSRGATLSYLEIKNIGSSNKLI